MSFQSFIGHDDAKLALILNAIDASCGGVLFIGERGSGKSTLARLFRNMLPGEVPFANLPQNATEEAVLGGIDLDETLKTGCNVTREGLLRRASGGMVYIDDVNLLAPDIIALILKAHSNGIGSHDEDRKQAAGASPFTLIASMNPEEGDLSPHFMDRFGLCVLWEGLKDARQKVAVMKWAANADLSGGERENEDLLERIAKAKREIKNIVVSPEIRESIADVCVENAVAGHRADVFMFYAARALAAFEGDAEVTLRHIEQVLPLVLLHRKRALRPREEQNPPPSKPEKPENEEDASNESRDEKESSSETAENDSRDEGQKESGSDMQKPRESKPDEQIFDIGRDFKVRRLVFRKDRINRMTSGRRTKTGSAGKRGRHIKNLLAPNDDIAVDATIRAAAPHQKSRGRKDMLLITSEDFRFKKREKKMGHLVILVVDGSGSMGAKQRMVETKGAIQSLLMDCYQKRDKVSLIVFRRDHAEVVLPPTASMELASSRLKEIPTGGKTPLSAGLYTAYNLIGQVRRKSPETRYLVVLVTDGRANQTLSAMPAREEISRMAGLLHDLPSTDYVVIDTEDKKTFIKADLAFDLAAKLKADYYRIDDLKADHIAGVVQNKKAAVAGLHIK